LIYPIEYEIGNQEWKAMLKNVGCFDITPYKKDQSKFEFWSRSITLDSNRSSLSILYNLGFVISVPLYFSMNAFWNSFHNSLEINKCGINGRRQVSNDLIRAARKHVRIYGPGGLVTNKPELDMEKCFDVTVGQNIENAIKGIKGTSVANLNPIRDRGSAQDIPGIGKWKIFTIAELDKFRKKDIYKPTLQVSTHTTPSSEWEMLIPNSSRLILSRFTRESLVKELEKRNF
ncbi:24840_t:CDS:2, partial [Dentiscutata erythropus]